jgi:hypothetical protein
MIVQVSVTCYSMLSENGGEDRNRVKEQEETSKTFQVRKATLSPLSLKGDHADGRSATLSS